MSLKKNRLNIDHIMIYLSMFWIWSDSIEILEKEPETKYLYKTWYVSLQHK